MTVFTSARCLLFHVAVTAGVTWGTVAVMDKFLSTQLAFSSRESVVGVSLFYTALSLSGLIGGIYSDARTGTYQAQLIAYGLMIPGTLLLLLTTLLSGVALTRVVGIVGLALDAAGVGLMLPCVATFMGDQQHQGQQEHQKHGAVPVAEEDENATHRRSSSADRSSGPARNDHDALVSDGDTAATGSSAGGSGEAFASYYLWANVGALLGESGCPTAREHISFSVVWSLLALAQVLGLVAFRHGRHEYVRLTPNRAESNSDVTNDSNGRGHGEWRPFYCPLALSALEVEDLRWIALVLAPMPFFWALYYQQASTWVMQTEHLDQTLIWNTPDILPAFNDLCVVLLIPIFQRVVYPSAARCSSGTSSNRGLVGCGSALGRMAWGMGSLIGAFALAAWLQAAIDTRKRHGEDKLGVIWQMPQYLLLSVSEVMVAVTGLTFVYDEVEASLHATMEAVWVGCQMGQLFCGVISMASPTLLDTLEVSTVLMAGTTLVFVFLGRQYVRKADRRFIPSSSSSYDDSAATTGSPLASLLVGGGTEETRRRGEGQQRAVV
jgi:dipeptide/tripeptide permease